MWILQSSDNVLLRRLREGDEEAWAVLVARYLPAAQALAFGELGSRDDAEAAAQAAFVKVAPHLDEEDFAPRLLRTVRDLARRPESFGAATTRPNRTDDAAAARERQEDAAQLRQAVLNLEGGLREIALLHFGGGLSLRDTARILGTQTADVRAGVMQVSASVQGARLERLPEALAPTGNLGDRIRCVLEALGIKPNVNVKNDAPRLSRSLTGAMAVVILLLVLGAGTALMRMRQDPIATPKPVDVSAAASSTPKLEPVEATPSTFVRQEDSAVSIAGQVVNALTGEIVPAFELAVSNGAEPAESFVELADREGRFALSDLPPGPAEVRVRAQGFAEARREVVLPDQVHVPIWLTVHLEPGGILDAVVMDAENRPIREAAIVLDQDAGTPGREVARTDDMGRITLHDLPSGVLRFSVVHPDYVRSLQEAAVAVGGRQHVEIRLDSGGSLAGRLRVGGRTLHQARVAVYESETGAFLGQGLSDADGAYKVSGLPPGPVGVSVQWEGGTRWLYKRADVKRGETVPLDAEVPAGTATLEGAITAMGEIPQLAKVTVGVVTPTGEEQWQAAAVSVTGKYSVEQLPHGAVTVQAYAIGQDSRARRGRTHLEISENESRQCDVDLSGVATITGKLTNLPAGWHARVFVLMGQDTRRRPTFEALNDMSDSAAKRLFVRANGPLRLAPLEAGEYTVIAVAMRDDEPTNVEGALTASQTVVLERDGHAEVLLELQGET